MKDRKYCVAQGGEYSRQWFAGLSGGWVKEIDKAKGFTNLQIAMKHSFNMCITTGVRLYVVEIGANGRRQVASVKSTITVDETINGEDGTTTKTRYASTGPRGRASNPRSSYIAQPSVPVSEGSTTKGGILQHDTPEDIQCNVRGIRRR